MTFEESLDFLYSRLPMFQRIGAAALKPDLKNTLAILEGIGNPHRKFKSVHIAGTNGKGTSAHSICSILMQAGYKTGLFTSPHLKSFTERIKVNGVEVDKEYVAAFVADHQQLIEHIEPSFFEVTFAMSVAYFAEKEVDIAVIETGLGGRLDSTNVIEPLVSLITMIGWDHADLLGDSLEKIASEKAGIIKRGVPVVIGADQPDLLPVFEKKALEVSTSLVTASSFELKEIDRTFEKVTIHVKNKAETLELETDITAFYYLKNIPGILQTIEVLRQRGFPVTKNHVLNGLSAVKRTTGLKGRWQILSRNPLVVADISHNEPGLKELFKQVDLVPYHHLHLVIGVVKDKDLAKIFRLLPRDRVTYYFTQSTVPRSLPAADLRDFCQSQGISGESYTNVNEAMKSANNQSVSDDLILVCGSTFVVAEIDGL